MFIVILITLWLTIFNRRASGWNMGWGFKPNIFHLEYPTISLYGHLSICQMISIHHFWFLSMMYQKRNLMGLALNIGIWLVSSHAFEQWNLVSLHLGTIPIRLRIRNWSFNRLLFDALYVYTFLVRYYSSSAYYVGADV